METNPVTKQETHVILVAFSAQGHINPLIRFGKRLISKGLHVTLATTEYARHRLLKSNAITPETNSISGVELLYFNDEVPADYDFLGKIDDYVDMLRKRGPKNLVSAIRERFHVGGEKKLACIISNPFVPWVIDAADELGLPCAMLWTQPVSVYAVYYRFFHKLNVFPTKENPDVNVQIPGLPLLTPDDIPSYILPSNPYIKIHHLVENCFLNINRHKWIMCNSFFELEKEVIESTIPISPVSIVGPIVPPSLLGESEEGDIDIGLLKADDACINWLDKQPTSSVIYVSFGSLLILPTQTMESIARALTNSKRPFIWVIKEQELPAWFLEETKDRGLVVKWSPQIKVLGHPSTGCFLTHCGWNSMLETIVAGVPIIAYPLWTDQPFNARLITDLFRVGLRLRPNEDGVVTTEEMEECIKEITDGPKAEELKANANKFKKAAREAFSEAGSSEKTIQAFVDDVIHGKFSSSGSA